MHLPPLRSAGLKLFTWIPHLLYKLVGQYNNAFDVHRSVGQGCPTVLYLFILIADVLAHMLLDPTYGVEIFTLPNGQQTSSQIFADTAFF